MDNENCCYKDCKSKDTFASCIDIFKYKDNEGIEVTDQVLNNYCHNHYDIIKGYRSDWKVYYHLCKGSCGNWIKVKFEYCKQCFERNRMNQDIDSVQNLN